MDINIDRAEHLAQRLQPWLDAELTELYATPGIHGPGTMLTGFPVWGKPYVERFASYGLQSLGSPANLDALADRCRLVIFTERRARPPLLRVTKPLRMAGVEVLIRDIPDWVIELAGDFDSQFAVLACAQNVLCHMAGHSRMGFHMMMPDQVWAEGYYPNLFRLAEKHDAITQTSVSTRLATAAEVLEQYRLPDATLAVPDIVLGDIASQHMHPESQQHLMNISRIPDQMPKSHRLVWKGTDYIQIHSCHVDAAWLAPRLMRDAPIAYTSTMDCLLPEYVPPKCPLYVPQPEDGMAYVEVSADSKPTLSHRVNIDECAEWVWNQVSFTEDYWRYFDNPSVMPCSPQEGMSAEEIEGQVRQVKQLLREHKGPLMESFLERRFGSRFLKQELGLA